MLGHVVARKAYFLIWGTLLALTVLTTGMAYVDLGKGNTVVALVIAVAKATLVVLFFMHVRWSPNLMRIVLLSALLWLAILICLTTIDFLTRGWTPVPQPWNSAQLIHWSTIPPGNVSRPRVLMERVSRLLGHQRARIA